MQILFSNKPPVEEKPSLAYTLGIGPCARWRTMASGITLTYEDNLEDLVMVHIAVKTRRTLVTDTDPVEGFAGSLAFGTV